MDAPNDIGEVTWPSFTFNETNLLYVLNTSVEVIQEYRQQEYAFWSEYIRYVAGDAPIPIDPFGEFLCSSAVAFVQ